MKKLMIFLMTLAIVGVFLAGCSPAKNDSSKDNQNNPQEEDMIVDGDKEEGEDYPSEDYEIEVGKLAPDLIFKDKEGEEISLKNLEGEEVSLEDYRGKIIFLNFWATWCIYCDKEMPDLQKLQEENDDMVVIAVDVMEDKDLVEKYIAEGNYDFEVVLDEKGKIAEKYLISAFPTTYIINKEGILLGRVPSMMVWDQMVDILNSVREEG